MFTIQNKALKEKSRTDAGTALYCTNLVVNILLNSHIFSDNF